MASINLGQKAIPPKIDDEERHPSHPRANAAARRAAPAEINARKLSPRHF